MKLLKYSDFIINELVKFNYRDDISKQYFISYRGNVYFFNSINWSKSHKDIITKLNINIEPDIIDGNEDYIYDDLRNISEKYPYILIGYIEDETIYILNAKMDYKHSNISDDIKKLKKELNIDNVKSFQGDDSDEFYIDMKDLRDVTFYHGTSLNFLPSIKKFGLKPKIDGEYTNFKNIIHHGKIFITSNLEKAEFHARTSAKVNDSYPIILEFKIPDYDKLVFDYDLTIDILGEDSKMANRLGYKDVYRNSNLKFQSHYYGKPSRLNIPEDEKMDFAKKLGVFGYLGRIPSSFITDVLIDTTNLESYIYWSEMDMIGNHFDLDFNQFPVNSSDWSELSFKGIDDLIDNIHLYMEPEDEYEDE